jgi:hypothetical protein
MFVEMRMWGSEVPVDYFVSQARLLADERVPALETVYNAIWTVNAMMRDF